LIEIKPSVVQKIKFKNREYLLKRDDLLSEHFSGNKARKFHYYLDHNFPHIKKIISHGSAQSNAMYSLSELAKLKNWEFEYYVDHIASYLKENPQGNYKNALQNGMQIFESNEFPKIKNSELFIPEGGYAKSSEYGIKKLADEINVEFRDRKIVLFLPSGTGTTALYLQKHLNFKVYTTACVGGDEYLKKEFLGLEKNKNYHPKILSLGKKYHFGKLYREFFEIWLELKESTSIEFDLLYDPLGWLVLQYFEKEFENFEVLYIHQGGVLGNESMLPRYERKFGKVKG
jgi:1-aminocyclopropane-1-carboxylate deaminase/D-cysteine desulfhydrase-like pyridoxal-dependent ACC family enzyme